MNSASVEADAILVLLGFCLALAFVSVLGYPFARWMGSIFGLTIVAYALSVYPRKWFS